MFKLSPVLRGLRCTSAHSFLSQQLIRTVRSILASLLQHHKSEEKRNKGTKAKSIISIADIDPYLLSHLGPDL
jgi:hypothetical protein